MVKLSERSSVNPSYSQAKQWDQLFRANYERYQTLIDKLTYSLQRKQRGILSLAYPKFYQADIERLEALKNIQELGGVYQQELDSYKNIEPSIACHYKRVFGLSTFYKPSLWQLLGVGLLIGSAVIKKPLWSLSSFLIIAPLAFDFVSYNNLHKTNEFLDFTLNIRSQKCILQRLAVDNGEAVYYKSKK